MNEENKICIDCPIKETIDFPNDCQYCNPSEEQLKEMKEISETERREWS